MAPTQLLSQSSLDSQSTNNFSIDIWNDSVFNSPNSLNENYSMSSAFPYFYGANGNDTASVISVSTILAHLRNCLKHS